MTAKIRTYALNRTPLGERTRELIEASVANATPANEVADGIRTLFDAYLPAGEAKAIARAEIRRHVDPEAMENEPPDIPRIRVMALSAPHGYKYCFAHAEYEPNVAIYFVGTRPMFLCKAAAMARDAKLWEGWERLEPKTGGTAQHRRKR